MFRQMERVASAPKRAGALLAAAMLLDPGFPAVAAAAAVQNSIRAIEVGPDEVTIKTDGPSQYRAFMTQKPPRLVLDIYDTQNREKDRNLEGEGRLLKRVRSGQYSVKPRRISRVVMELADLAEYQVLTEATGLRVLLGGAGAAVGEAAGAAARAVTQARPAPEPVALLRDAPAQEEKPSADETALLEEKKLPEEIETEVRIGPSGPAARSERRSSRREIMASLPREKVNLDFDQTDVRDILKLLGVRAGVNLIYGTDVAGQLSLHLRQVPFDEAFRTILQMSNLTTQQVGENIIRIMTPESLKVERGKSVPTTRLFQLNYTKGDEIKTQIDAVRSAEGRPGSTVVAKATNSLIVTDTQEGMLQIERLIAQLDQKPKQVMIEAKLIEVQLSKGFDMGIQWDYQHSDRFGASPSDRWITGTTDNPQVATTGGPIAEAGLGATGRGTGVFLPASKIFGALTLGRVTNRSFLTATLTAAASQGKAKVLSDPKVATLNNQQATINITTQIPYVTSNVSPTGTTVQSVAYVTVGITLVVVPTINADGRVTLQIQPTVSQPSSFAASAGTTGAPAVDTRTAQTTVLVRDGETIVIGGLIQDTDSTTTAKVPLFGDIPLIGFLFRSKHSTRQRQELLVFVTPKILTD